MVMGRSHQILNIKIGDNILNQVQSLKYLCSTVTEQSTQEEVIENRIAKWSRNAVCKKVLVCMSRLLNLTEGQEYTQEN